MLMSLNHHHTGHQKAYQIILKIMDEQSILFNAQTVSRTVTCKIKFSALVLPKKSEIKISTPKKKNSTLRNACCVLTVIIPQAHHPSIKQKRVEGKMSRMEIKIAIFPYVT